MEITVFGSRDFKIVYYDQYQKVPGSSEAVTDHVFTEVYNLYINILDVSLYDIVNNIKYFLVFVVTTTLFKTECKNV